MVKALLRHVDRVVILIGFLSLVLLSVWTLHNVALMAADISIPNELRRDFGDLTVLYTLNAGNNKPVFFNRYGDALVEYSAWSSFVTVDGITLDLWSHAFSVYADKPTNRVFLSLSSGNATPQRGGSEPKRYQIEQQVEVHGSRAIVRYYIIPNQPVRTVRLVIGHYGWYFERLRVEDNTVLFDRPNLPREQYEQGDTATRSTPVGLRVSAGGKVEVLRNHYGTFAFPVTYLVDSPPPFEKSLLAEETVFLRAP